MAHPGVSDVFLDLFLTELGEGRRAEPKDGVAQVGFYCHICVPKSF